jgi:hypothetical protein
MQVMENDTNGNPIMNKEIYTIISNAIGLEIDETIVAGRIISFKDGTQYEFLTDTDITYRVLVDINGESVIEVNDVSDKETWNLQ